MANPPKVMKLSEDVNDHDQSSASSDDDNETVVFLKLKLPRHISAYIKQKELDREVTPTQCDKTLTDKVFTNYVIVKKILSNLSWQDKMLCKHVCTTWRSCVNALRREQLSPVDFSMKGAIEVRHANRMLRGKKIFKFKQSGNFYTEPLVVFGFAYPDSFIATCRCQLVVPSPCTPPCKHEHCLIDIANQYVCAPKNCMITARANALIYMPLQHSPTFANMISYMTTTSNGFISGVHIPMLPDVEFYRINIKARSNMQQDFYSVVDEIAKNRIIKGIVVYVTEKYLLHSLDHIAFLNYFKEVQPNIPYALGGCLVEDVLSEKRDFNAINQCRTCFSSANLISMGLFTIPKDRDPEDIDEGHHFEMYSLIIESTEWTKALIIKAINEFANKVPQFEHSLALKLSCVGRDQQHAWEQDYFRAAFPRTTVIGCYGNGELGVNHPPRPTPEEMGLSKNTQDRHEDDPGPQYGIMYSYSTIFLFAGWGKILDTESK